jgi:hypothetical protein
MNALFQVKFATYGALVGDGSAGMRAIDATRSLQQQIDMFSGIVAINNDTMGKDPAIGTKKHFGAIVTVNGLDIPFACEEGQTIDFHQAALMNPDQIVAAANNIVR